MLATTVLGIESSCDDTAAAVYEGGAEGGMLLSNAVSSQGVHDAYGGVVPELASRDHQRLIIPVVHQALEEAGIAQTQLDAVAVTCGPGLSGSLLVGLSFAKAFALGLGAAFASINHLEGHVYSVLIEEPRPPFPYLCLVVSGGHTQLVLVEENFRHTVLGRTRDDAAGEAFDKVAQLIGLGYPGGPAIDRLARSGDPAFHPFPRSTPGALDFSFSGLKTSVLYYLRNHSDEERVRLLDEYRADLCAAFQQAVVDVLVGRIRRAAEETGVRRVAITGGVAANSRLRAEAEAAGAEDGFTVYAPALRYCMDNAAMIAVAGCHRLEAGHTSPLTQDVEPRLAL